MTNSIHQTILMVIFFILAFFSCELTGPNQSTESIEMGAPERILQENQNTGISNGPVPIYSLFKQVNHRYADTFYCSNYEEASGAIENYGYEFQGITAMIHKTQQPGTVPFYRFYNPVGRDHFYSRSPETPNGYNYEFPLGYVYTTQQPGTLPLYRLWNNYSKDHFYTTDQEEVEAAIANGYRLEFIACYVLEYSPEGDILDIPDPGLEQAIREELKKPLGEIYSSECLSITKLDASDRNITDLTGLEYFRCLNELDLSGNRLANDSDLAPIRDLPIEFLDLSNNQIHGIFFAGYPSMERYSILQYLKVLDLRKNPLSYIMGFHESPYLEIVFLPSSNSLDTFDFSNSPSLKFVSISDGIPSIPGGSFDGTPSLRLVTIPESLDPPEELSRWPETLDHWLETQYVDQSKLDGFNRLPNSIRTLGNTAFEASGIEHIDLSQTEIRILGGRAFAFSDLKSITMPIPLERIEHNGFLFCQNLSVVCLPEGLKSIGWQAFSCSTALTSINLPQSLEIIGESAFEYCSALKNVTIPSDSNLQIISDYAFHSCKNLEYMEIPNGVTWIGAFAFSNAADDELPLSIYMESSIAPEISNDAFYNRSLQTLFIPEGSSGYVNEPWTRFPTVQHWTK